MEPNGVRNDPRRPSLKSKPQVNEIWKSIREWGAGRRRRALAVFDFRHIFSRLLRVKQGNTHIWFDSLNLFHCLICDPFFEILLMMNYQLVLLICYYGHLIWLLDLCLISHNFQLMLHTFCLLFAKTFLICAPFLTVLHSRTCLLGQRAQFLGYLRSSLNFRIISNFSLCWR